MREADDSGPGVLTVSCGFAPFVIGPALTSRVTRDARTDTITIASLLRRSGKIMSFVVAARVWHGGMLHTTRRPHLRRDILLKVLSARAARWARTLGGPTSPLRTPQAHQAHPHEHRTSKTVNLKCASPALHTDPHTTHQHTSHHTGDALLQFHRDVIHQGTHFDFIDRWTHFNFIEMSSYIQHGTHFNFIEMSYPDRECPPLLAVGRPHRVQHPARVDNRGDMGEI